MTGIAELHAQALDITGRIVAGIPPDRWHAATPCQGWDTRALLNHLVSGNLRAAGLAAGATIENIGDRPTESPQVRVRGRRPPQKLHVQNGITRHKTARPLTWPC
jgi:uncharacterized protein (TIGR03083 family)